MTAPAMHYDADHITGIAKRLGIQWADRVLNAKAHDAAGRIEQREAAISEAGR